jgi:photosystem II stability/assembly factor-like uncharacterized protein
MTLAGTVWVPIGPSPISQSARQDNGLTSAIAVSPNDGDVIYQGTAGGGVWRTTDGGATWTPIFDRQISLGIGEPSAIAIDPNDTSTVYVGTSRRVARQAQAGLFKSTDGGASCVRVGSGYPAGNVGNATQFVSQFINVIIVDPADSQTLYLASANGVSRSADGGLNWAPGLGSAGDARSLVLDTSSPAGARVLYAGLTGGGVIRSNDGGRNWTQILGAATPAVSAVLGATPGAGFGKVVIDLAPPTTPPAGGGVQVLYVALEGTGGAPDPLGLFLSIDQGANWTRQAATGMPRGTQQGYSFHMAVDPGSPGDGVNDIIYFGCVGQARSIKSGTSFNALAGLHADTHAWAFFRQPGAASSTVYCGNDGGIYRSADGTTWNSLNSGGLQTTLFYNLAVKPDATASETLGALQDNGLQTTAGVASPTWTTSQGGDGWDIAYDGQTANRVYGTSGFWPAPCTRVFVSTADGTDFPPTVPSAQDITPWGTASDAGCYLASIATDPSAAGIVYVSGNQNLWQSRDGGSTWRNIGPVPGVTAVAPTNGNNVVVAVGTRVFVSTNALAPTVGAPAGVTFADITRDLPSRNVLRAAFDPNDPTVIYAVLGGFNGGPGEDGHVFRTTIGGTVWEDISPPLDVPFGGLALDASDTPTTIYVGTDLGVLRSVDLGATWTVLDDIHLPRAPVTDLVISRQGGVLRAATYGRGVFEFTRPQGPAIAVNLERGLNFGTVCEGPEYLTLQVFNVGAADLVITSVQRLMGSAGVSVLPSPGTPLIVKPGEEIDFTVQFAPTTPGTSETATIRINSNDPGAPVVDLLATGTGGVASLELGVPDNGDFGAVCLGSFVDRGLVLNNRGPCTLRVTGVASSSPEFIPPGVTFYPLVIEAGGSIELPIRFQPTSVGPASAVLTVTSNDPGGPHTVLLAGSTPAPRLVLAIADTGDFGKVCVGSFRDQPLTLTNSGGCALTVSAISSSSPEFVVPDVDAFPLTIAPGASVDLQIRFQPTSFGAKGATLTVSSDDPGGPRNVNVSGQAPSGELAVSGTGHFGAVDLGRRAERSVSICNVGECELHVTRVAFRPDPWKPGCRDCDDCEEPDQRPTKNDQCCATFKIVSNPFPATVRPGSCLGLLIRFTPKCGGSKCCELVIESDDPVTPVKTLYVTGRLHLTLVSALKCWSASELHKLLKADEEC